MCYYPKLILNPKYKPNKKNHYNPPQLRDERKKFVPIGCGKCQQCMRQKARDWNIRLNEEIKQDKTGIFVTLTFSDKSIKEITDKLDTEVEGYNLDNMIATYAVRHFLERVRKKTKRSIKHFLITELGHNGTENLHLHGILFTQIKPDVINKLWSYGYTWLGYQNKANYISGRTINYITKYIFKIDISNREYKPTIYTSPGLGKSYTKSFNATLNQYNGTNTNENYINKQGYKLPLPIYLRNKLYSEEQRENLWTNKLDKGIRYLNGIAYNEKQDEQFYKALNSAQKKNKELGYGDDTTNYDEQKYKNEQRQLKIMKRKLKALSEGQKPKKCTKQ